MPINRDDPRALHLQVADELRLRIHEGEFGVGKIPSLDKLSKEYGVTEVTAHNAVKLLQQEGIVASAPGRGTFVKAQDSSDGAVSSGEGKALREEIRALAERVARIEDQLKALG
ncbi:GntR family transcriptional regulator [Streptodolium elevatio]|uniref:GntR family transcriptional regulator n=1 Tax=Streptodolium elevatio TaxID=3157996 RepID=A0ABV3DFR1_9ACTN